MGVNTAKCQHTGLPVYCCGHCNGTRPLDKPVFIPPKRDDTPVYRKGRDKAEWQGIGEHHAHAGDSRIAKAAAGSTRRGVNVPRSAWGTHELLRTCVEVLSFADDTLLAQCASVERAPSDYAIPENPSTPPKVWHTKPKTYDIGRIRPQKRNTKGRRNLTWRPTDD